jgi:stage II sporulation SpoAA-like protein
MLTLIIDVPENVAAFRATGKVNENDYDNVLIPAVNAMVEKYGKINFLLVLDTDLTDFSVAAILKDIGMSIKYYSKWHKIAVVSASNSLNAFTDIFGSIAPGESKGFVHEQLEDAKRWVSA